MRSYLFISALIGLAVAAPHPQEMDFEGIEVSGNGLETDLAKCPSERTPTD